MKKKNIKPKEVKNIKYPNKVKEIEFPNKIKNNLSQEEVKEAEKKKYDFVAKTSTSDRICVSGYNDGFYALFSEGKWKREYPEFEDLVDNFNTLNETNELKDIIKYSKKARRFVKVRKTV